MNSIKNVGFNSELIELHEEDWINVKMVAICSDSPQEAAPLILQEEWENIDHYFSKTESENLSVLVDKNGKVVF